MDGKKIRRTIALALAYLTILLSMRGSSVERKHNDTYPYNDDSEYQEIPYATYSNGNVYIADEETIKRILVDSNDVFIIDDRRSKNPDMCIVNSFKITSPFQMNEILNIIMRYEAEDPTDWNRTKLSCFNEWSAHSLGYVLGIKQSHTENVDLDNNDEERFRIPILTRGK